MRQVVCLSGEAWSSIPNRTQQLMSRLRDSQVIFFDPPLPRGDTSWKGRGRRLRPDLIAYSIP